MSAHDDAITQALNQLQFLLATPLDFRSTDNQSTVAKVRLLSAAAAYFNVVAVTDFGGRPGPPRSTGLVEQVVGAAFQTYEGIDPHPDPFDKATMLLRGITQGHPFTDGNKRTGYLTAAYFLERVGYRLPDPAPTTDIIRLCVRVSSGELRDVRAIARELRAVWSVTEG